MSVGMTGNGVTGDQVTGDGVTGGAAEPPAQQPPPVQQPESPSEHKRRGWAPWGIAALVALVLLAAAWLVWNNRARGPQYGVAIDAPSPAENFTLPSSLGTPVSLADYRGETVLLYFGYTTCPDVCPTTLADLKQAIKELGDRSDRVQVLMVSVDPERDTAQRLAAYLKFFDPSFVGLTGTVPEIEAIASRFGVIFQKNTANSAADYLVDHTSAVLVLDADGYLREMFPYGTTGRQMAADVSQLMR